MKNVPKTYTIFNLQLTLIISNSMGPWKKFESTVVRLKRSYENTGSVVCLTTKGRQLERNFEELKPALHVPILGTIYFLCLFLLLLNQLSPQFLDWVLHWFDQHLCVRLSPPGLGPGPSPDTRVTVSSEDILKDMFEVKKFPLLLQLLIKSNIFSNLSKLRNYTSSLMKINFRQIIQ